MRTLSQIWGALLLVAGLLLLVGPGGTAEARQVQARKKPQLIVGSTSTGRTFGPDPCPVGCTSTVVAYATHIEGLDCPLFAGEPKNETTARFTQFNQEVKKYETMNGQLWHGILDQQGDWYFNPTPTARSWNNPDSFKTGTKIATSQNRIFSWFDGFTGIGSALADGKTVSSTEFTCPENGKTFKFKTGPWGVATVLVNRTSDPPPPGFDWVATWAAGLFNIGR